MVLAFFHDPVIVRPEFDPGPEDLPQDPDHGHPEEGGGGGELRDPRHRPAPGPPPQPGQPRQCEWQ